MKIISKLPLLLVILIMAGCSSNRVTMGFNADLSNQQLAASKPVKLWIAPVTVPRLEDADYDHSIGEQFFKEETRASLARNLKPVKGLEVSLSDQQPLDAYYRLDLEWQTYEATQGVNPAIFLAGPFFLALFDSDYGGKIDCNYRLSIKLSKTSDQILMAQSQSKQASFNVSGQAINGRMLESVDQCYQARSQLVEQLMTQAIQKIRADI